MTALNQLFEKKPRLYPQNVKGYFRRLKWFLNFMFLTIYLFSPALRYHRGGGAPDQAILIDLPNSRAYFFFIEIWPSEVYYLAGILIFAAVILFFITSLFGRIWCGYACFQTVWTDIFIAIERLFQGDRNQRILLDRKKNSLEKFFKKFFTHLVWIIIGLITGFGFIGYFNDYFGLANNLIHFDFTSAKLGWIIGIAGATYVMAGFAREHVCTYMCPYARFQSAMFDKNTLIITYDEKRGEQRGKYKQGDSFENRGHCIDCKQCVVVCPQGIDIRDGLQMECIACGLCIDACDNIMEKVGLPKGLIRYDTLKNLENTDKSKNTKFRFWRGRTIFYLFITIIVSSVMIGNLTFKKTLRVEMIPNRNPIFVTLSDESVRNGYSLKITNETHEQKNFSIIVLSPTELELKIASATGIDQNNLPVGPGSISSFIIYATLPKSFFDNNEAINRDGRNIIELEIIDNQTKKSQKLSTIFISN
jgi:cytochrome c oxidase accessory protein FixG